MIGGFTGWPVANATGPGTPIPMPRTSAGASRPPRRSSSPKRSCDPVEHRLRAVADVEVQRDLGERGAGEVADGEPRVRRAEVGDQHDARRAWLKASIVGGRPPVEALPPAS